MSEIVNIQLQTSSILRVPLQSYANDFTFIVNGESIPTSRLISEILSPKISKIHSNDPTIDYFIINTTERGDFRQILKLVDFDEKRIAADQIPFFIEVLELLGNESLSIGIENKTEITIENVITQLLIHEKHPNFYHQLISEEIGFISSHFYELCEAQKEGLKKLEINTLYSIIGNLKLQLKTENQLLTFINELYSNNSMYSILYETVIFENVTPTSMREFISIFNLDDMTTKTWNQLSSRLCFGINKSGKNKNELKRYKNKVFQVKEQNEFDGIFNYLQNKTNGHIENVVNFTSSDNKGGPINVVLYNDQNKYFNHYNKEENWICFDFKEHRVIPTDYKIKSMNENPGWDHPKNWIIEASNDNKSWETIDEETDCPYLNGRSLVHTFKIQNQNDKEFQYIRMRLSNVNWCNRIDYLSFESFEIYGALI